MSDRFEVLDAARAVAEALDQGNARTAFAAAVGCHIRHGKAAYTYEDDEVIIVFEKDSPAGGIEIKEKRDADNKLIRERNPAVMVSARGVVYRYHGQIHDVAEHIRNLASPLRLLAKQAET